MHIQIWLDFEIYYTAEPIYSYASDCLYTVAINQTIISVSNKKTSSCESEYGGNFYEVKQANLLWNV